MHFAPAASDRDAGSYDDTDKQSTLDTVLSHSVTSSSFASTATISPAAPTRTQSRLPTAAIVGLVVLGLGIVALLFFIRWLLHRHRMKLMNESKDLRSGFIAPFHEADDSATFKTHPAPVHAHVQPTISTDDSIVFADVPLPPYEVNERPSTPTTVHRPPSPEDQRAK
jgi:hypothetical protein